MGIFAPPTVYSHQPEFMQPSSDIFIEVKIRQTNILADAFVTPKDAGAVMWLWVVSVLPFIYGLGDPDLYSR